MKEEFMAEIINELLDWLEEEHMGSRDTAIEYLSNQNQNYAEILKGIIK